MSPTQPSRRWLLLAAALLAVSLAGFGQVIHRSSSGTQPAGGEPVAPEAPKSIVCFGHVTVDGGIQSVHPLQPGRVAEVYVREGDTVAAGAPLLRMHDPLGQPRADEAKAALDAAEAELAESRSAPERYNALVEQQKLAIEAARQRVDVLRFAFDKKKELQGKGLGGVSATDIEVAKGELRGAELAVQAEQWKQTLLQFQNPQLEIRLREIKVAGAKARYEQARAALREATLTAEMAGTALRVSVTAGDTLAGTPRQPAIEFVPDRPQVIKAEVQQAFASRVAAGQPVRVEDDAHAGGVWTGRVVHVSGWFAPPRSVIQEPLQFNDVRTLECVIALDPGQPKLRINQRVLVTITTSP